MISPTNRLLAWLAVLLPFAAAGALVPAAAGLALAVFAGLFGLAVADAVLTRATLRGLRMGAPDLIRLCKDRAGTVPLVIRNESRRPRTVRIGLPLPPELGSSRDSLDVRLPAGALEAATEWDCTPAARGSFRLENCYLETASPLGFWNVRGTSPCQSEIRVYPNLLTERRRLAAVFLNRGPFGLHAQRMVGQGRDFEKLREYSPGDSYEDIHWKATAKRGRPITKLYQMERTQEIYVLIDASRLSGRGMGGDAVLESFINSALVLGLAAEQQGDLFGLLTFSNKIQRFIRAGSGKAHHLACRDAVCSLKPQLVAPDFDELFTFVRLNLRRRALLMVLTDLGDPVLSESFLRSVDHVCRQHMVLVCMVKQPGIGPLFAAPDAESLDQVYRNLGGHMIWRGLRELGQRLRLHGVTLALSDRAALSAELVQRYLGVKARQSL